MRNSAQMRADGLIHAFPAGMYSPSSPHIVSTSEAADQRTRQYNKQLTNCTCRWFGSAVFQHLMRQPIMLLSRPGGSLRWHWPYTSTDSGPTAAIAAESENKAAGLSH
jgi:hypothetical protein